MYFTENGNPSNKEELLIAAQDVGLDIELAKELLDSDQYAHEVMQEQASYRKAGIQSVPSFIIDDTHLISGGQPKEAFASFFTQYLAKEVKN